MYADREAGGLGRGSFVEAMAKRVRDAEAAEALLQQALSLHQREGGQLPGSRPPGRARQRLCRHDSDIGAAGAAVQLVRQIRPKGDQRHLVGCGGTGRRDLLGIRLHSTEVAAVESYEDRELFSHS